MADNPSALQLEHLSIEAAINSKWDQALEFNKEILKLDPENIECMNRLAKAYFELGKYLQAQKIYLQVLKLDPYNLIAQKNLKKASVLKKNKVVKITHENPIRMSPSLFLEEPGITKLVNLIKVAEPQKLLTLSAGTLTKLVPKNRGISVTDQNSQYLGVLPDDISHYLLKLIKGGNKYQSLIKSVKPNGLTILIREEFRAKKFKNQPSFIENSRVLTYSSQNIPLNNSEIIPEQDDTISSEDLPQ